MATLYMLHVESFLSERPLDNDKNIGVSSERREWLKRFGNWVACQCDGDCRIEWNFANDVGLFRSRDGGEVDDRSNKTTTCPVVKKLFGGLKVMDLNIEKERAWLQLTKNKWINSRT